MADCDDAKISDTLPETGRCLGVNRGESGVAAGKAVTEWSRECAAVMSTIFATSDGPGEILGVRMRKLTTKISEKAHRKKRASNAKCDYSFVEQNSLEAPESIRFDVVRLVDPDFNGAQSNPRNVDAPKPTSL